MTRAGCCCGQARCSHMPAYGLRLFLGMLQVCGGCGLVRYCSIECQSAAWHGHRRLCRENRRHDPVEPAFFDMRYAEMLPRVPPR